MLILGSTTDIVTVAVASAGQVDVHASWMDNVAGAVGPGRTNTATITTPTTTTVVGSPAASVQRNLKTLLIRNRGTGPNDVTVNHSDGTTVVSLHKVTLAPGGTLQYIDEVGFLAPITGIN